MKKEIEIVITHTIGQKEVYATALVGGKKVKAVAKCNDTDVFDLRFGGELAAARVEQKIGEELQEVIATRIERLKKELRDLKEWQSDTNDEHQYALWKEYMMLNHPHLFI